MCLIEIFSESSENNLIQIKLFDDPKPQLDVDIQKLFHFLSKGYYEVAAQTTKVVAHNTYFSLLSARTAMWSMPVGFDRNGK